MKLLSKTTKLSDVGWWLAFSACLFLLYVAFLRLGFASSDSKGLSLLGLLAILAIGLSIHHWWFKARLYRRYAALTFEEKIAEMEKVLEEQVAAGVITRSELKEMRERARNKFDRKNEGGVGGTGSL